MTEKLIVPEIAYQPCDPQKIRPGIGLIGCGAITGDHLAAYQAANYDVVALCDIDRQAAEKRSAEFFPDAAVYTDHKQLLAHEDVQVVDITTHPDVRTELIEDALMADKHVLSQKPFVLDLDVGRKLVELADQRKLKLAVNQNARWAPHFSYMRAAVRQGVIGQLQSVHFGEHWNHNWVLGTKFENVRHLILYDYAIHWFDMLTCLMQDRQPQRVYASFTRSATQKARPALLGQAVVEYEGAQASLVFDGDTRHGPLNTSFVAGTLGTLTSHGPNYNEQRVTLTIGDHRICPLLQGTWFPGGFHGTMGELLRAIEEDRPPEHAAANNLQSLALCYAAVASAEGQQPVVPGSVQRMPAEWHTP